MGESGKLSKWVDGSDKAAYQLDYPRVYEISCLGQGCEGQPRLPRNP